MNSYGSGLRVQILCEFIWFWGPGLRLQINPYVFRSWAQIPSELICFWRPGLRLHMNSFGFGVPAPDSIRVYLVLCSWARIPYEFIWFAEIAYEFIWFRGPGPRFITNSYGFVFLGADSI